MHDTRCSHHEPANHRIRARSRAQSATNKRLLKEATQEGKARVKSEMDKKVMLEQIQALKKHNSQLSIRCSEEVKAKLKEAEERKVLEEKIKTMSGRIASLLNKMQADEEAKIVTKEEMKKMHAQITSLQEKSGEVTQKLFATAESNRVVTEALRCKQDELDAQSIKMDALQKKIGELAVAIENSGISSNAFDHDNQENHGAANRTRVCVVDVREQLAMTSSENELFDDLDTGFASSSQQQQPLSTMTGGPGSAFKLKMTAVGAGTGLESSSSAMSASIGTDSANNSSSRLFSRRPLSAAALKKHKEKLQQRKKKLEDAKRQAKKEAEWNGRAGGLDATPTPSGSSGVSGPGSGAAVTPLSKKLPPITNNSGSGGSHLDAPRGGVNRTNSAPVLKKKLDDDNDPSR